jgi:hypothetical protein
VILTDLQMHLKLVFAARIAQTNQEGVVYAKASNPPTQL